MLNLRNLINPNAPLQFTQMNGVFGVCWRFKKFRKGLANPLFIVFPRGESEKIKRVTDGTRTRNSQNHNLELYH